MFCFFVRFSIYLDFGNSLNFGWVEIVDVASWRSGIFEKKTSFSIIRSNCWNTAPIWTVHSMISGIKIMFGPCSPLLTCTVSLIWTVWSVSFMECWYYITQTQHLYPKPQLISLETQSQILIHPISNPHPPKSAKIQQNPKQIRSQEASKKRFIFGSVFRVNKTVRGSPRRFQEAPQKRRTNGFQPCSFGLGRREPPRPFQDPCKSDFLSPKTLPRAMLGHF